jgi:proteasome alpha subunit
MVYSPFDFNEANRHRMEYVEDNLRGGSPVVGVSFDSGLLLLTVRQSQRKVFEVYDRLIFSAIGKQADIEAIRIGAIDVAHREGFERSPDDVTVQRLVGFSLSPPLKRVFGDAFNAPAVIRALFGELGARPEEDLFFVLNYDGEFSQSNAFATVAGTPEAEDRMALWLMGVGPETTREQALERALKAWAVGAMETRRRKMGAEDEENPLRDIDEGEQLAGFLREELKTSQVEVGILERFTGRESKFRLLANSDLEGLLKDYR